MIATSWKKSQESHFFLLKMEDFMIVYNKNAHIFKKKKTQYCGGGKTESLCAENYWPNPCVIINWRAMK